MADAGLCADVYSLGVVAFELWHSFETGALLAHAPTEACSVTREEASSGWGGTGQGWSAPCCWRTCSPPARCQPNGKLRSRRCVFGAPASARYGASRLRHAVMRCQRQYCCPAQAARLVRWLTQGNPAQRPSAVEVLRSELLPPSVADEQLTDLLRSIPERCEVLWVPSCARQPSASSLAMRSVRER